MRPIFPNRKIESISAVILSFDDEGTPDFAGLGRMILTYPDMIADILEGKPLQRKRICCTFSDCTTAPRNGMVGGCYLLDEFYIKRPEAEVLKKVKREK
jgi:NADPH2 dehydrogenase